MKVYDTFFPQSADDYLKEFKKIIEFDILSPEGFIKIFSSDFDLRAFITGSKVAINADQEASVVKDMQVYIMVAVLAVAGLLVALAGIFLLKKKHSDKIKGKLAKAKNDMIWNGVIRSVYISIAQIFLTSTIQAKMLMRGSRYSDSLTYAVVVGTGIYAAGVIASMTYTLWKYQNDLSKAHVKKTYENLYVGVNYKRKGMRLYYWVYFIVRRVLFFVVPIILWSMPLLQLQILCFFTSLYIILIVYIRPHVDNA